MRALLLAAAVALGGCAHLENAQNVCEQYRGIRCLETPVCAYDRTQGCDVCRCPRWDAVQPPPSGIPLPGSGVPVDQ
ncbi:MAG TPA: hypothetical protein VFP65_13735 [Anaeromyxobacteraceae bacterium]|nr:hypothetical protein [Anaeromyxobacteraceae bacterium]